MADAAKKNAGGSEDLSTPQWHANAVEVQKFDTVTEDLPHPLDAKVRGASVKMLNQLLANSIVLRDMYKKHHWQVAGPTFYQLHLLFDKHHEEQSEIVDLIAERVQVLGGVSVAMGDDAVKLSQAIHPPMGKEEVPVQISRLLELHKTIMQNCLDISEKSSDSGDEGTNDLAISDVLRPNELQSWFIRQHLVEMPLVLPE